MVEIHGVEADVFHFCKVPSSDLEIMAYDPSSWGSGCEGRFKSLISRYGEIKSYYCGC